MEGKPFSLLFTHMQLGIKRGELGRWVLLFLKTLDELENEMPELREISTQWKKRIQFFNEHFQKRLFDGP